MAMRDDEDEIKTMQLYNHIDRVFNELKEMGIDENEKLNPETLSSIDSLHYLGNEAIHSAISKAQIESNDKVLDIGSGLGGPARMLAHLTGCHVDAMELQADLSKTASILTSRCDLNTKVVHFHNDFLTWTCEKEEYSKLVSWLVFLHISDRDTLYRKCAHVLKPKGLLYVEDFYMKAPFTPEEERLLRRDVYVSSLPTWKATRLDLQRNGLEIVEMVDLTTEWTDYVADRYAAYEKNLPRHVRIHGEAAAHGLLHFYSSIHTLFESGHLGGIRYVASKSVN